MIKVEIFSKENCHLCDLAKKTIFDVSKEFDLEIKITDINSNQELFEKFKYDIPVIYINDKIAFKHKIDKNEFIKKLLSRNH